MLIVCMSNFSTDVCTDDVFQAVKTLLCPEGMVVVCLGG